MPHQGQHPCDAACVKIIIDTGGRLAAAATLLYESLPRDAKQRGPAVYLAMQAQANARALVAAIENDLLDADAKDRAHAWSELNCHRAAVIEAWAGWTSSQSTQLGPFHKRFDNQAEMLFKWANEDRLFTTGLVGGEYAGAYVVNGTDGITLK